jgi:hypothetical protein
MLQRLIPKDAYMTTLNSTSNTTPATADIADAMPPALSAVAEQTLAETQKAQNMSDENLLEALYDFTQDQVWHPAAQPPEDQYLFGQMACTRMVEFKPRAAMRLERNRQLQLYLESCTLYLASKHEPFTLAVCQALISSTEAQLAHSQGQLEVQYDLQKLMNRASAFVLDEMRRHGDRQSVALPVSDDVRTFLQKLNVTMPQDMSPVEAMALIAEQWVSLERSITQLTMEALRSRLEISRLTLYLKMGQHLAAEALAMDDSRYMCDSDEMRHPAEVVMRSCAEDPFMGQWPLVS